MKYYSRLIALLLAVTLLMTNVIIAEGQNWEDTTLTDLESAYAQVANQERTPFASEDLVLGFLLTIQAFETVVDKTECSFTWYRQGSTEPIGTGNVLELRATLELQVVTCQMTKNDEVIGTQVFNIVPAQTTDLDAYLNVLYTYVDEYEDTTEIDKARNYEYMLLWNTTVDAGNLAELVLNAWKAEEEYSYFDNTVLCSCVLNGVESSEYVLHPDGAHLEGCGWYNGITINPDDPDQPPLYEGKPEGNQYTETLEYTLPMEEDRAVILQTGARAILTSESTTPGVWQVYTGNEWVDIQGDNTNVIEVTEAKLNTIFELTGIAQLRYFDKANSVVLDEVSVTTKKIANGEYVDLPEQFSLIAREVVNGAYDDGNDTYCTIVINYVYENGEIAEEAFVADLDPGSGYNNTIVFPTKTGYDPYYEGVPQSNLVLDFAAIDSDYQYTVVYKPAMVNYTVIHYHQNTYDDNYTPFETETLQGLTKSVVPGNLAKLDNNGNVLDPEKDGAYKGFYALLYETPEIAADGKTVVEIYYDRYYYLMNFDLDGGYGTEPIYARYGAALGEIVEPTKPGYEFQGWYLYKVGNNVQNSTDVVDLPTTMPNENRTYKAIWKADDTAKVTIVFWGENADDEGYSYIKTGIAEMTPGSTYTYSNDLVMRVCGLDVHVHTDACSLICGHTEQTSHTDACYTKCKHVHDRSCYTFGTATVSTSAETDSAWLDEIADATPNNRGVVTVSRYVNYSYTTRYYVEAGGQWYQVTNGRNNLTKTLACSHTHGNSCLAYSCGLEEHTHNNSCNQTGSGMDSSLWTLRTDKNQTVTVAADGSTVVNVYYDRTTFNIRFYRSTNANLNNYIYIIEAKWGQNISSHWPIKNATDNNDYTNARWDDEGTTSLYDEVLVFIEIMPAESFRLYYSSTNNGIKTMYYYVEALPGAEYEATYTYSGTTKYFVKAFEELKPYYGMFTEDEDFFPLRGFDKWTSNPQYTNGQVTNQSTIRHYYTRHTYSIVFYNPTELIKTETGVPYEAELGVYNFEPTPEQAPAQYEPGSVEFVGWYLNPECTGDEYILEDNTMPAGEKNGEITLSLYAKWEKVTLTVEFYLDKTNYEAGNKLAGYPDQTVQHGNFLDKPANPTNGDYTFVGWFYMDGDEEKAFDFANMPVKQNLKVYGKWYSNVLKEFVVYYKVKDADGKDLEIAARTTGSLLAGATKTFDAKVGTELNAGYQEGYFPEVKSHSLTANIVTPATPGVSQDGLEEWYIKVDEDGNPVLDDNGNQQIIQGYTFWYVQRDAVPYVVHYVTDKQPATDNGYGTYKDKDGKVWYKVAESKTVADNKKAVVTEPFAKVNGMMADAYQKRLVLDPNASAEDPIVTNAIVFYYTEDTTHAYYKMSHYIEGAVQNTWEEKESFEAKGDIGSIYTINPKTFTGFTLDKTVTGTLESGTLTADGLHLKLYYKRNSYPYYVRYLDKNTYKELATTKEGTGLYQQEITESAIPISNYTAVAPTTQTISIRVDDGQGETRVNVITFLYTENSVNLKYVAVTRTDGGWNEEDATGGTVQVGTVAAGATATDTVAMVTGAAKQAEADPTDQTYKFAGWYTKDANGVYMEVLDDDGNHITTPTFVPEKPGEVWESTTYYALFDWNMGSLTITKNGLRDGESAIFKVEAESVTDGKQTYYIVLSGNANMNSATITNLAANSEYTVTEQSNWSWSYRPTDDQTVTGKITAGATVTETFTNNKTDKWLHDENGVINDFKADENDTTFGMSDVDN